MHVSEISFCENIGFNIKSEDTKRQILSNIEKNYNLKIVSKHFETFTERLMPIINNNLHLICARTNGNPYFLYLVKINFTNYCIFIDKKIQQGYFYPRMIIAHLFLDDSLFEKDVIFDGEMTRIQKDSNENKGEWVYLINDLLVYNGKYLSNMNLVKRLNLCYEIMDKHYRPSDTDIFRLMIKKYFNYNQFENLLSDFIPSRSYTCRGVYFKPLYLKFKDILVNFDDSLVKTVKRVKISQVKQTNFLLQTDDVDVVNNTLEVEEPIMKDTKLNQTEYKKFMTKKTQNPDVYEIYDCYNNMLSIAYIPNLATSKKMREIFKEVNLVTKIELPYEFSEKFKKWMPKI